MEAASRESMYELLQDPLGDRKVKDLPLPPIKPLSDDSLFDASAKEKNCPNWKIL
jgi:hypothetical protein